MSDQEPWIPAIPTESAPTTGHIGLWQKAKTLFGILSSLATLAKFIGNLTRQDQPQDPKRLGLMLQAVGLFMGFLAIAGAVTYRIVSKGDVGNGAIWALAVVGTLFTGGQVIAHFKPDSPLDGGPFDNLPSAPKGVQNLEGRGK